MTIEHLKALAQNALEHGIERIRETGDLTMMFHLVGPHHHDIVAVAGDVTNSEAAKAELARDLKARVKAEGIEAVIMVSDTYIAEMTREQEAVKAAFRLTVEDCFNLGMIPKREAVSATLESPTYQQVARQEYKRIDGDGGGVELVGVPDIISSVEDANGISGRTGGRFMSFFEHQQAGRA